MRWMVVAGIPSLTRLHQLKPDAVKGFYANVLMNDLVGKSDLKPCPWSI